jgi:UDP-3-O-[3-hydroxymyristoyl] glucosamine N-acyltransferase
MTAQVTAARLAAVIGGELSGDGSVEIRGISDLKNAVKTDVSFILADKYAKQAQACLAPVIISDSQKEIPGKAVIFVKSARHAYIKVINFFHPETITEGAISPKASVSKTAKIEKNVFIDDFAVIKDGVTIGENAFIGAGVFVGKNCSIAKNTKIYPNVSIYDNTEIGTGVIIHSGAVLGADGFGFIPDGSGLLKVPQIGKVKIGNNVEIGANCTIDRAAFGATLVSDGVKIDNLVMLGHNVEIGENTIIVSQTGISGSTKVGKACVIGGQVGIVDHVTIGDGAQVGSQAGIPYDIEPGAVVTGTPARPVMQLRKAENYMMKLEDLFKRVKEIEKKTGLK